MKPKENYAGIDYFRIISALLIAAIHTSPLSSLNGTADFILTRVVARIAVPFFFMASGFFLLPESVSAKKPEYDRLLTFLKRIAILYALAMFLYLPLNIYAGAFTEKPLLPNLLKNIFINGTFYHLWYLPAAMLGAAIAWLLLKKLRIEQAIGIALVLYIIGLFGDSYYGIVGKISVFESFYAVIFTVSDYTRNGLFFAPIFFLLGGLLARQRGRYRPNFCCIGLAVSFSLMLTEGLFLHAFGVQRHDSMYFMLLPCMFFLFQCLLLWRGKGSKDMRNVSMLVYILHPLVLVLIRGFAKATSLEWLFIDNSVGHFLAVALCSFTVALLITMLMRKMPRRKRAARQDGMDRAWAEIDLAALSRNVQALYTLLPSRCKLMAVVKANAYGHGDIEVAKHLSQMGIHAFAVATIDEGIRLRKHRIKGEILILGCTVPQRAIELVRYRLSQTVTNLEHAKQLNAVGKPIHAHVKVDTGMHRLGEDCDHVAEIARIFRCKHLEIDGIFTHLCVSDSTEPTDVEFTKKQMQSFCDLLQELRQQQLTLPKIHMHSSYGVINYPQACDYARVGIALYGALSRPYDKAKLPIDLCPVLALKTRVALVRTIAAGESVSYGRQFTAQKETRIAVLPIGYADGLPRSLSCKGGDVLLHGYRAPIVGRICMDQLMVDVTELPDVRQGDIATLIGMDGVEEITAEQVAENSGTITNELLSRLSNRLERIFL